MSLAERFVQVAKDQGVALASGVPCSRMRGLIDAIRAEPELRYVGAANEGDAVAIAAGAELGGQPSLALMQNSGLGNAVNPLSSLTWAFEIPILLIVSLRGDPEAALDARQHQLMGRITAPMLDSLEIPWRWFPGAASDLAPVLSEAMAHMREQRRPAALLLRPGLLDAEPVSTPPEHEQAGRNSRLAERADGTRWSPRVTSEAETAAAEPRYPRADMLAALRGAWRSDDLVIATTGHTSRELHALGDRPSHLYMVGSMGCALSLGLGLAIARPERRVIVLDGDGAALMRLGAMATAGHERPANLLHLLLDNGVHASTGGQETVSGSVDFVGLARACGYPRALRARSPQELEEALEATQAELCFVHLPILPVSTSAAARPDVTPAANSERLRALLGKTLKARRA